MTHDSRADRVNPIATDRALALLETIRRALPAHGTRSEDAINACEGLGLLIAELRADAERYRAKRDIDAGKYIRTSSYISAPVRDRDYLLEAWFKSYDMAIDAHRAAIERTDQPIPTEGR